MNRLPFTLALLLSVLSPLFSAPGGADNPPLLELQAGDRLRGQCEKVEAGTLYWRTTYGDTIRVPIAAVVALEQEQLWDLEFTNGHTARGAWRISGGTITVASPLFGSLQCPATELRSALKATPGPAPQQPSSPSEPDSPSPTPAAPPPPTNAPPSSLETMLRQSSVLLRPGQWSVSTEFSYIHDRVLYSPFDTRHIGGRVLIQRGITPRLESALAFGGLRTQTSTRLPSNAPEGPPTVRASRNRFVDPEVSVSTLLVGEGRLRPECVAVTGLTVPVNDAADGGLFRSRIGLEFLKTSDPGALFAGFAWIREMDGWEASPYQPVDRFSYHLGMAIGLNDELAIGVQAQAEYRSTVRSASGTFLAGSTEPVSGRIWFNLRATESAFIEGSVTVPMNDDAHATVFGCTFIRRY